MNKKIGIFMPGRLASERLPNKLILPLGDSCLWDIACKRLNNMPDKYEKFVLINDKELIEIAEKYENIKIIIRDEHTCTVDGPLKYIFKDMEKVDVTHLMFLNPCLSLVTEETLLRALEEFGRSSFQNYATSVKPYSNWLWSELSCELRNELVPADYATLSTKDIRPRYEAAHVFHIFDKQSFYKDGLMLKKGHMLIEVPKEELMDVDDKEDYEYAKFRWEKIRI